MAGRLRPSGPSLRPALVVVAIATGLLLLFGIGAILSGSTSPPPAKRLHVRGTSLAAEAAGPALAKIEEPGTPPSDVLGSLVVPKGSQEVAATPWNGETQFSGQVTFSLATSQAAVVDFFEAELKARGWTIFSTGAAPHDKRASEVLAQRESDDGWYWEAGVVATPTTFATSTTGSGSGDTTRFTLDLFEESDADS